MLLLKNANHLSLATFSLVEGLADDCCLIRVLVAEGRVLLEFLKKDNNEVALIDSFVNHFSVACNAI